MIPTIVGALITSSVTIIVFILTNIHASNKRRQEQSEFTKDLYAKLDKNSELADEKIRGEINVIKTEITELRGEVQKHNGVVERVYKLEQDSAILAERSKRTDARLEDLERFGSFSV